MTPNEILKIIETVVRYGWPWQFTDGQGPFFTHDDQSLANLCDLAADVLEPPDFLTDPQIRLDPNHVWDWPIETREGMPCWARIGGDDTFSKGIVRGGKITLLDRDYAIKASHTELHCVAPHPLHPDQPPSQDWTLEGRRVLE